MRNETTGLTTDLRACEGDVRGEGREGLVAVQFCDKLVINYMHNAYSL